jgi:hypothetical protein
MTTYNLYRNGTKIASGLTSASYVDTGLTNGTVYSYQVSAVNNGVESALSAVASAVPLPGGNIPSPIPPGYQTPLSAPFAAPTTTATVAIPLNIDATGTTDVSGALNAFVAGVPNGRIISFPASAIYRLDKGIQFAGRSNLIFEGNGCTLKVGGGGAGTDQLASPFVVGHTFGGSWGAASSDIIIRNFTLIGNSTTPGVFVPGVEGESAIIVAPGTRVEISGITGSAFQCDGLFVEATTDLWMHDCHFPTIGRNGVTVVSGTNVLMERNAFDVCGYLTFDLEPNDATEASLNVTFRNNTAGTWGVAEFFAMDGSHTGASINGVTVTGNTISGKSLKAVCDNGNTARMLNVTFSGNTSTAAAVAGPVLTFAHIDGLTVQHNTQPLSGGSLISATDCTSTTLTPNP